MKSIQYHPSGVELRELRLKARLETFELAIRYAPNSIDPFLSQITYNIEEVEAGRKEFSDCFDVRRMLAACGYENPPPLDDREELVWLRAWHEAASNSIHAAWIGDLCDNEAQAALKAYREGEKS